MTEQIPLHSLYTHLQLAAKNHSSAVSYILGIVVKWAWSQTGLLVAPSPVCDTTAQNVKVHSRSGELLAW